MVKRRLQLFGGPFLVSTIVLPTIKVHTSNQKSLKSRDWAIIRFTAMHFRITSKPQNHLTCTSHHSRCCRKQRVQNALDSYSMIISSTLKQIYRKQRVLSAPIAQSSKTHSLHLSPHPLAYLGHCSRLPEPKVRKTRLFTSLLRLLSS